MDKNEEAQRLYQSELQKNEAGEEENRRYYGKQSGTYFDKTPSATANGFHSGKTPRGSRENVHSCGASGPFLLCDTRDSFVWGEENVPAAAEEPAAVSLAPKEAAKEQRLSAVEAAKLLLQDEATEGRPADQEAAKKRLVAAITGRHRPSFVVEDESTAGGEGAASTCVHRKTHNAQSRPTSSASLRRVGGDAIPAARSSRAAGTEERTGEIGGKLWTDTSGEEKPQTRLELIAKQKAALAQRQDVIQQKTLQLQQLIRIENDRESANDKRAQVRKLQGAMTAIKHKVCDLQEEEFRMRCDIFLFKSVSRL
jgi:hypothetical protein